jgi:hypothetical protein
VRHLPLITAISSVSVALAACSSTTMSTPTAAAQSPNTSQSCAAAVQSWTHGTGGKTFRSALTAGSAMRVALESGSSTRVTREAHKLNSAASRARSHLLPACVGHGRNYQLAMGDWMTGAVDAKEGNLKGTSSKIAAGAREIEAVAILERLSPITLKHLSRRVTITIAPTPTPTATQVFQSPVPTASAVASATSAGCYPLSNEGTCYESGEYCRNADHGASGVAGNGEAITCEDNNGWRWEPA